MMHRFVTKLTRVMNALALTALVAILLIMFTDMVLRYFLQVSVLGAYELIEYLMVIVISFCLAHTEVLDGHVRVSMVGEKFGATLRRLVRAGGCLVQALMLFMIMTANVQQARYSLATHAHSAVHKIPVYPFYYVVAFGFGIFAIVMLLNTYVIVTASAGDQQ